MTNNRRKPHPGGAKWRADMDTARKRAARAAQRANALAKLLSKVPV